MKLSPTFVVATILFVRPGAGGEPETLDSDQFDVRFYDISALTMRRQDFAFTGRLPASTMSHDAEHASFDGIVGSAASPSNGGAVQGGGGFGGGGGGGLFSVPFESLRDDNTARISSQFAPTDTGMPQESIAGAHIIALMTSMVRPESWQNQGDGQGQCRVLNHHLIVRQSVAVHKEVKQFLNGLVAATCDSAVPLQLTAWWIPVNAERWRDLHDLLNSDTATAEAIDVLCDKANGLRAVVNCECNQAAHVTSGIRQPVVADSEPQVGTGAVGYASGMETINFGLLLEVTPVAIPEIEDADTDDVSSRKIFQLNLRSAITTSGDNAVMYRTKPWDVDRIRMKAHVVESPCRVQLDRAAIAGTMTADGEMQSEFIHIAHLTEASR